MSLPERPTNPRVVYPDGTTVPILKLWYGTTILGTHVWISEDPQFVPWTAGVHTAYDDPNPDEPHHIIVGFDLEGVSASDVTAEQGRTSSQPGKHHVQ